MHIQKLRGDRTYKNRRKNGGKLQAKQIEAHKEEFLGLDAQVYALRSMKTERKDWRIERER